MAGHARLSPSAASRWMACPGSVRLTEHLPDSSSVHADLGTDAHELAALCLVTGTRPREYLDQVMGKDNVVDHEMVEHVDAYLGYLFEITHQARLVERWVDLSHWLGEPGGGTADAILLTEDTLHIVDLKYGKGVEVSAEGNSQLRLYALGALRVAEQLGITSQMVTMHICQPRLYNWSEETLSVEELLAWGEEVKVAAARTREPDAPLVPGPVQCKFCRAKATCPALATEAFAVARVDPTEFPMAVPPAPDTLTDEQIARVLTAADMVQDWIKAVQGEAMRRAAQGGGLPGWKLVAGKKGARSWAEPTSVAEILQEAGLSRKSIYKAPELLSPAQMEKLIGKKAMVHFADMITRSEGSPALVPESDKRPAITLAAVPSDFLVFEPTE